MASAERRQEQRAELSGSRATGLEGVLSLAWLVGAYACLVLVPELLARMRKAWRALAMAP